jgi:hypothetical protein
MSRTDLARIMFDLSTLFAITVFASATAGLLLLFSWLQHHIPALALWGLGFLLGSAATALVTARGVIPDVFSIELGHAILAITYGVMWSGVRNFEGRRPYFAVILAGAVICSWRAKSRPSTSRRKRVSR